MTGFRLVPTEISALRIIANRGEVSLQELSALLEKSLPYGSQIGSSLVSKGIVQRRREGRTIMFRFAEGGHASAMRSFILEHGHMDLERILGYSNIEVLASVIGPKANLNEIVKQTELSRRTVTTSLANLKAFGIVVATKDSKYEIGERFGALRRVFVELARYLNEKTVREISSDATIIWQWKKEFLFRTWSPTTRKDCLPTALSIAPEFGIQLFLPDSHYYFRSQFKSKIRVEDAILHSLLIDKTDARILMAVLLLWKKHEKRIKRDYLFGEAVKYGLKTLVVHIELYIKDGVTKWEYLPSVEEFEQKAGEYGL